MDSKMTLFPVRKQLTLQDYLLNDFSSCSSNGFRSYPRRQCCTTTVRYLLDIELRNCQVSRVGCLRGNGKPKPALNGFTTAKPGMVSVFRRASAAVINAVKYFPLTVIVRSSSKQTKSVSLSRKLLKRSFWKRGVDRKEVPRWTVYNPLLETEMKPPLELVRVDAAAADDQRRNSRLGSDFIASGYLSRCRSRNTDDNNAMEIEKVVVSEDSISTEMAVIGEEIAVSGGGAGNTSTSTDQRNSRSGSDDFIASGDPSRNSDANNATEIETVVVSEDSISTKEAVCSEEKAVSGGGGGGGSITSTSTDFIASGDLSRCPSRNSDASYATEVENVDVSEDSISTKETICSEEKAVSCGEDSIFSNGSNSTTPNAKKKWANEEDEDQFSPVSVLDCPFDDEDDAVSSSSQHSSTQTQGEMENLKKTKRFGCITLEPFNLEKQIESSELEIEAVETDINRQNRTQENEEHNNQGPEHNAAMLLQQLKATFPSYTLADRLLFDFFYDNGYGNNNNALLLQVAEDWIVDGKLCEFLDEWNVEKNRQASIQDMECKGKWKNKLDDEIEEVALELEYEVYSSLVEELICEAILVELMRRLFDNRMVSASSILY